jgi:hypothetical protein
MILKITDFEGESQRKEVEAVCEDIMDLFAMKLNELPPLGAKPIVLFQAPDGWPRACFDCLPSYYRINLGCLKPYTTPLTDNLPIRP